jgi:hypothetical protein
MTAKGLRKCRAGDSEENQKQVSRRSPRALGNRRRDFHIPAAPATTAMGKEKSKNRIPTFPQRLPCPNQTNQKRKEINPSPKPCPSGSSQDWNMLRLGLSVFRGTRLPRPSKGSVLLNGEAGNVDLGVVSEAKPINAVGRLEFARGDQSSLVVACHGGSVD